MNVAVGLLPSFPGLKSGSLGVQLSAFADRGNALGVFLVSAKADNCTSKALEFHSRALTQEVL
jgi:hypothetical protein